MKDCSSLWVITLPTLGAMERISVREKLRRLHPLPHQLENHDKGFCRKGKGG